MPALRSLLVPLVLTLALACSGESADKAKDKAKQLADEAKDQSRELADDAKDKSKQLVDEAKDKGKQLWAERPKTGELSDRAKGIVAKGAAESAGGVEALLGRGTQVAPVALEVGKSLYGAMDRDTSVEPIVQDLDDAGAQAELDERIADMPRVETIDGVDVGFKDVTSYDSGGRETESAYLILWRADKRLIGLIYRSRKRVNLDQLVADAPRLLGLVKGVM